MAPRGLWPARRAVRSWRPSPLLGLAACGSASGLVYLFAFSAPYSIQNGLATPLLQFARITGPSLGPTLAYMGALAALFALYLGALRLCARLEGQRSAWVLLAAWAISSGLVLLPMYPVFSLDVFYYMAADRIWSVYRENPFVVPPLQAAHDPFFPYTSWGHYTLPYGPLWPWIASATGGLGRGEVAPTLVAFKALALAGYLACIPLVSWAVGGLHPARRLLGTAVFACNPLALLELVGGAHNDAVALVAAAGALGLWARGRTAATAVALAISFLVKATAIILAPPLLWASVARAFRQRRLPGWALVHLVPAGLLVILAWTPFWSDRSTGGLAQEASQYYQSLTAIAMTAVPGDWRQSALRAVQTLLLGAYGLYFVTQLGALSSDGQRPLEATWRLVVAYFLVVAPFYSAWYMIWPTLLAAMIADRRHTLLTTLLAAGGLGTYLVQFVLRPLGLPGMGWAQINLLSLLTAFGPFLIMCWVLHRTPDRGPSITVTDAARQDARPL